MRVLGLDPSLNQFGWSLHDTEAPVGRTDRCLARGRLRTSSKQEFIDRFAAQRDGLRELLQEHRPDRVGLEFPVFGNLWSEESKRKMSLARKGKSMPHRGVPKSAAQKEHQRQKMLEYWSDPEKRAAHSGRMRGKPPTKGMTGKRHSEETRRKISAARKAYFARKKAGESP